MPLKTSELYSSLWQSCDELRGGMDASQYKDYVLVLLFVKYVSDKAASQKGYLLDVPKGGSFADMVALKGDKEIGDKMNKIIARLAEANDLKGVIDVADFNDADKLGKGQDMVGRLTALVSIFQGLDFGQNCAEGDDLLGDAYEYTRLAEISRYSRMMSLAEISDAKNDFNLNLPRYIDSTEPEDLQDIDGHLRGGIPNLDIDALENFWQVFPAVRATLFKPLRRGFSQLSTLNSQLKEVIFGHAEFTAYNESATKLFAKWRAANTPRLKCIAKGGKPKALIETLSEDLLATFEKARLLDAYDVYQHLMDYWAETMQDDVCMIVSDGWREAAKPRLIIEEKEKKTKEKPDFTVGKLKYKAELIPTALVIARYFADEQTAIEKLEAEVAASEQALEEMAEEHGGEDGLLEAAKNDKDKLTKASVAARLKDIKGDADAADSPAEAEMLNDYLALAEKAAATSAKVNDAQEALLLKVAAQYGRLTEDEIKTLVVDDKWLAMLAAAVQGELDRVSQTLTGRIRQLAERYATPLPQLTGHLPNWRQHRQVLNSEPLPHDTWTY